MGGGDGIDADGQLGKRVSAALAGLNFRRSPVSWDTTSTLAPGITTPLLSDTVPVNVARSSLCRKLESQMRGNLREARFAPSLRPPLGRIVLKRIVCGPLYAAWQVLAIQQTLHFPTLRVGHLTTGSLPTANADLMDRPCVEGNCWRTGRRSGSPAGPIPCAGMRVAQRADATGYQQWIHEAWRRLQETRM
jgi:hypothetical protein